MPTPSTHGFCSLTNESGKTGKLNLALQFCKWWGQLNNEMCQPTGHMKINFVTSTDPKRILFTDQFAA